MHLHTCRHSCSHIHAPPHSHTQYTHVHVCAYTQTCNQEHCFRVSFCLCVVLASCQLGIWFPTVLGIYLSLVSNHRFFSRNVSIFLLIFNHTSYTPVYVFFFHKIKNIADKATVPSDPFYNAESLELPRGNHYFCLECIHLDFLLYIPINCTYLQRKCR